ncbi:MAG: DUF4382 domain-containing protein [Halodesulfurarchaeum sp.]
MSQQSPSDRDRIDSRVPRRRVLALGAGIGISLLAGCSSGSDAGTETTDGADGTTADGGSTAGDRTTTGDGSTAEDVGHFELLISDRPADIDDFDRLSVTFDSARIFEKGSDSTAEAGGTTTAEPSTTTEPRTETTTAVTGTPQGTTDGEGGSESQADGNEAETGTAGFVLLELDDPTVDLTRVVGKDAIPIFAGKLPTGTYTKIELNVAAVEGVVDGDSVPVTVPSGKLQIVNPFTVSAENPVRFVFDVSVVKKGPNGYNLLPVISESGVAGTDVPVNVLEGERTTTQSQQQTGQAGQSTTESRQPTTE